MAEGLMSVVWDLRRVRRGGPELVAERQRTRLADLLARAGPTRRTTGSCTATCPTGSTT
ncbi:hypothetical protein [Micromonospora tarensis]|uniref:Uncharacterized protein n=1 Tax=Micromonospora tarensis TaxID=2806100 RepID=A0ABS1YAQ8_9ACTN|nr:hypothetical protein [Micromonospora tarensis]MBM0274457.1 hypothetical protein [Micromonospora tarensis]